MGEHGDNAHGAGGRRMTEHPAGVIVIDPLLCTETAAAALRLYREHRGDRPVRAVVYDRESPGMEMTGSPAAVDQLLGAVDHPLPNFDIVTP